MALKIDTSAALRRYSQLAELAQAVVSGGEHDEGEWLECKSTLDLKEKATHFAIAKAIIGFANRDPDAAANTCEGCAYIVVGVQPSNVAGVATVDLADLDPWVGTYVGSGSDGPAWSPQYVELQGKHVLIVTVEPPKAGDPIHTLRKTFDKHHDGTVFVRKGSSTAPATSVQMSRLQERVQAGAAVEPKVALTVSVAAADGEVAWLDLASLRDAAALKAEALATEMLTKASAAKHGQPTSDVSSSPLKTLSAALAASSLLGEPDSRTFEQFEQEVSGWKGRLASALERQSLHIYCAEGFTALNLVLEADRFLHDVEVDVTFDLQGCGTILGEYPPTHPLPRPPRPLGQPSPSTHAGFASMPDFTFPASPDFGAVFSDVTVSEDGATVTFSVKKARLGKSVISDELQLCLLKSPPRPLVVTWSATAPELKQAHEGTIAVLISESPLVAAALVDAVIELEATT